MSLLCHMRRSYRTWCVSQLRIQRRERGVSTWSPLANAFNTGPMNNSELQNRSQENVGLFGIRELTDHTGFTQLQRQVETRTQELIDEATDTNRTRKLVVIFDELSDTLCRVADMADFVRTAHPLQQYSSAAEETCVQISSLVEKLNTNVDIHRALADAINNGDNVAWNDVDSHVAQLFMFDFEQCGIHLPEEKRLKFVELNDHILMLGSCFEQGCHKPVTVAKQSLPPHLKYMFSGGGSNVQFNGLQSESSSETLREAAYRVYLYRNPEQEKLLEDLLSSRSELANLVGFPSYAHRSLRGTLAETPENVMDFLQTLADKLRPRAELDFKEMGKLKEKQKAGSNIVMPWDTVYYSGLAKQHSFNLDSNELSEYFSLGSCMEGLDLICRSLYGVSLQHEAPLPGEVWSNNIHKVAVIDEEQGRLGTIYLDLFEREGKPYRDCHFTIQGGRELDDGTYQNPVVVLMVSMAAPRGDVPALLTPCMVDNFFHEFGHALHSMLGRTRYQHVMGTRCPTDFAEVPSQFMEYFSNDYRVLRQFARHWKTGEPLSQSKAANLCRSKKVFAASDMQMQVLYAMVDQAFHAAPPLHQNTLELVEDLQKQYYSLPAVSNVCWHLRFGHFVGYGAKYYSYLMSRAVASKVWHQCFKADPLNRHAGNSYRYNMLAHGGGRHPKLLVEDMLNEEPSSSMLVSAILDDLQSHV